MFNIIEGDVVLNDTTGNQVNPATKETLDSIKNTDGIKKITDALPAGTNLLGKVQIRNPGNTADLGDVANPIRSDPTGTTTQPVSASSLPLPTGAATEATLVTIDSVLDAIKLVVDSIKDTDGIKKITDALPAGTNNIGDVDVLSSALPTGAATETTLSNVDSKLATIDSVLDAMKLVLDSIKDTDGVKKITDALPTGDNTIGRFKITDGSNVVDVFVDTEDSVKRLQIYGKVSISAPHAPASATAVTIAGDTPLDISTTQNAEYIIPDGETFTLTSVSAGAEGDPTEKGSKVEVIYYDGTTEHLVERMYITGQTVPIYPDTSQARDGTAMTGNGSTKKIIVRRLRLSGTAQEVDAVARGYVQ